MRPGWKTKQAERLLTEPIHRWLESTRNDDFVLRGEALRDAERWAISGSTSRVTSRSFCEPAGVSSL